MSVQALLQTGLDTTCTVYLSAVPPGLLEPLGECRGVVLVRVGGYLLGVDPETGKPAYARLDLLRSAAETYAIKQSGFTE